MNKITPNRVQPFYNTTAGWAADVASSNPFIPAFGELCIEDTGSVPRCKLGDGIHNWASLGYITGGSAPAQTLQDTLNLGHTAVDGVSGNTGQFQLADGSINQAIQTPSSLTFTSSAYKLVQSAIGWVFGRVPSSAIQTVLGFINPTAARAINFPDKSGTVAMLSDIPSPVSKVAVFLAAQTTSNSSVATLAVPFDGTYHLSLFVNVTAIGATPSFVCNFTYTDENGISQTLQAISVAPSIVKPFPTAVTTIRATGLSNIVANITVVNTTYDIAVVITKAD